MHSPSHLMELNSVNAQPIETMEFHGVELPQVGEIVRCLVLHLLQQVNKSL